MALPFGQRLKQSVRTFSVEVRQQSQRAIGPIGTTCFDECEAQWEHRSSGRRIRSLAPRQRPPVTETGWCPHFGRTAVPAGETVVHARRDRTAMGQDWRRRGDDSRRRVELPEWTFLSMQRKKTASPAWTKSACASNGPCTSITPTHELKNLAGDLPDEVHWSG